MTRFITDFLGLAGVMVTLYAWSVIGQALLVNP